MTDLLARDAAYASPPLVRVMSDARRRAVVEGTTDGFHAWFEQNPATAAEPLIDVGAARPRGHVFEKNAADLLIGGTRPRGAPPGRERLDEA
ncbi:MAG: hypothetical protein ACREQM_06765 [Candidatus Dormibacteraceae bacterium]